jgi:hypothetical protein
MAKQTPFFMSGPRLLIKVDGEKVAYAVGLDLRVSRNVQVVNTLGSFASVALQATMYNGVSGSMQIVRLADTGSRTKLRTAAGRSADVDSTQPVPALSGISGSVPNAAGTANSVITATNNLKKHLDPTSVLASSTFDIEVWQLYPTTATQDADGLKTGELNNEGVLVKHFTIQNCRLNSRSASISAGQLLTESFSFTGTLLVSDDRKGDDGQVETHDSAAFGGTAT